ncbi:MAG: GNAT family N-acetyltransferase [Chloroflexi bacterium]|nr:GNAT family N-acetyltransferase [Chloroflexota bacterium]
MKLRQASPEDRVVIEDLVASAPWSHVHLDWLDPTSLTEKEPFILATVGKTAAGTLGCPPDLPGVAWVRTFAVAEGYDVQEMWEVLWTEGVSRLLKLNVGRVGALALEDWLERLVLEAGFERTNSVIFYEIGLEPGAGASRDTPRQLRSIRSADLQAILELDRRAFEPMWQLSGDSLAEAITQASSASLIEDQGEVLGYQITTSSPFGAHLARLAVQPSHQREGLGTALVNDAIESIQQIGLGQLSVNTQEKNTSSRRLYEKLGFRTTGKEFPVFEIQL